MKLKSLYIFVALLVLNACASNGVAPTQAIQNTGDGTLVIHPIEYNKDAYIREPIIQECNLPGKLTQYIAENAANQYTQIITDSGSIPADAQILKIEIEQVGGLAGGAWTGSKRVLIKGTLTKNGKVLGDFKASRYSGGGMFAVFKGTCVILGRCVRTLGSDVARWLTRPISKALLGNM
jgi:hypothetical protein